jgi:phenylpropionate dioxygenase-like ring-hydroxylating dioxygenase large terminal subunit
MKPSKSTFPLNAWYAAAYDVEVSHALFARTICKQKIVMYRQSNGQVAALEDACWHRLLPLSMGRLEGDEVVCGYHGLTFNGQGQCTHMPSQETINPAACVRSFPVIEKHRFIWIWPGDPALADASLVPDLHWNHDTAWAGDGSSIGNRAVAEAPFVATHGNRSATVTRWMENIEAPPFWAGQLKQARGYEGPVDRWQIISFEAPCTVSIDVGVAQTDTGAVPPGGNQGDASKSDRTHGVNGMVLNTVTPETDCSCHYFWAFARNYMLGEQRLTHQLREGVAGIFREDEHVLEAQQKAIDEHPDHVFYNLNIDAGSMWARRLIDGLIAKEQQSTVIPIRLAA